MTFCSVLLKCCSAALCSVRVFDRKPFNVFCTKQHQPCLCAELCASSGNCSGFPLPVEELPQGFKVDLNLWSESALLLLCLS